MDILPGWQGRGFGRGLLGVWEGRVRGAGGGGAAGGGVKGVYVGVDPANERAVRWYVGRGFVERDMGEGRRGGARWLVKKLV